MDTSANVPTQTQPSAPQPQPIIDVAPPAQPQATPDPVVAAAMSQPTHLQEGVVAEPVVPEQAMGATAPSEPRAEESAKRLETEVSDEQATQQTAPASVKTARRAPIGAIIVAVLITLALCFVALMAYRSSV